MRWLAVPVMMLCAGAAPVSAGQAPVHLYFHPVGGSFFINTQQPQPTYDDFSMEQGLAPLTLTCGPEVPDVSATSTGAHTWYGHLGVGPIDYERNVEGHPFMSADTRLPAAVPLDALSLHVFVQADPANLPADAHAPGAGIAVRLSFEGRAGGEATPEEFASRALLFQGAATATLARQATSGATWESIGGTDVYRYDVPLELVEPEIPAEGLAIRFGMDLDVGACNGADGSVMAGRIGPYWGEGHWSTLEATVAEGHALRMEYFHAGNGDDGASIAMGLQSAWGRYDLQDPVLTLTHEGKSFDASGVRTGPPRTHQHGHEADTANYRWDLGQLGLADGSYELELTVHDLQGTSALHRRLALPIEGGRFAGDLQTLGPDVDPSASQASPGPGMPVAAGLAVLCALAVRRRARR